MALELKDFLIGLMAFAAIGLITISFITNLYDEDNLNMQFENETQTKITALQTSLKSTQSDTNKFVEDFQQNTIGGENVTLSSPSITSPDLLTSALKSLFAIPQILSIFANMLATLASTLNINITIFGFILGAVMFTLIYLITQAVISGWK